MVTVENAKLHQSVSMLEQQNRSLLQQLMDLRRSLGQPATLLVLALAFSFVFVPSAQSSGVAQPIPNISYPSVPLPSSFAYSTVLSAALGAEQSSFTTHAAAHAPPAFRSSRTL